VILHRLEELGLEQQELARAAPRDRVLHLAVTDAEKKRPPPPNRTDIYDRMDKFLKLPRRGTGQAGGSPAQGGN